MKSITVINKLLWVEQKSLRTFKCTLMRSRLIPCTFCDYSNYQYAYNTMSCMQYQFTIYEDRHPINHRTASHKHLPIATASSHTFAHHTDIFFSSLRNGLCFHFSNSLTLVRPNSAISEQSEVFTTKKVQFLICFRGSLQLAVTLYDRAIALRHEKSLSKKCLRSN